MRLPTPHEVAYRWHRQAIEDMRLGLEVDAHPDSPQCGWFKRTLAKRGVFVPARIWIDAEVDIGTGELLGDETFLCEVDGVRKDAVEQWSWLCQHPIPESEFDYLTALRRHAVMHEPDLPIAQPHKPVDWLKAPLPSFNRKD